MFDGVTALSPPAITAPSQVPDCLSAPREMARRGECGLVSNEGEQ
jgi:hypothetical protein